MIETIFIEGHTDNIPFAAGTGDNYRLSLDRARTVEATLVQDSALKNMRNEAGQPIFSFSAYADSRPRPGVDPADPSNRRVDLRVVLTYRPINEVLPGLVSVN
jgi:flagellar motor protein MotB